MFEKLEPTRVQNQGADLLFSSKGISDAELWGRNGIGLVGQFGLVSALSMCSK
jgi:hypothetical protein